MFVGLVLLVTRVLPFRSSVAVALATLVIAALFNPMRRRVPRAVDRRFDRARYDAEAVVVALPARLRRTVDLDAIRGDLVQRRPRGVPARPRVGMAPRSRVTEPAGSKEIGHDE